MNKVHVRNMVLGVGMPKICVPIVGRNEEEIVLQAGKTKEAGPDLAEWRADWFEGVWENFCGRSLVRCLS